jgi:hypothetical protein
MEIPLSDVISAGGAVIATSVAFSKMFFSRITVLEASLTQSIQHLTETVTELDKRLAVNSCIIDRFMEEGCYGTKRNKETHQRSEK